MIVSPALYALVTTVSGSTTWNWERVIESGRPPYDAAEKKEEDQELFSPIPILPRSFRTN